MPRPIALLLTTAFVYYLFRRDVREKPDITGALWIPLIWMLLSGSRFVSQWLGTGGVSLEEGSPLDRTIFIGLIVAGILVLRKRHVRIWEVVRNNGWLTFYFLYCFAAIFWSDYQYVSFKRWIKTIGEPVMVLVVFSEPNVSEALTRLVKRATYLIAPYSIMLIKYFPEWGRRASQWGAMESGGVTGGKNALGADCFILGFFLFCHFLKTRNLEKSDARQKELWFTGFLLWMVWWNMIEASSSTALVALLAGMLVVLLLGSSLVAKRFVGVYAVAAALTIFAADYVFGFFQFVIGLLGEDSTLTGRTELWQQILDMDINPLIGTGFDVFWMGDRLKYLWSIHWWMPNEAHNGYLETYINLGLIGLAIVIALIIATFRKGRRELLRDFEFGRMRLGFLAAFVIYNWSESGFRALHIAFFGFYIVALDYHKRSPLRSAVIGSAAELEATPPQHPATPVAGIRQPGRAARTLTPGQNGSRGARQWPAASVGSFRPRYKS